jgi:hypothetical protein
MVERVTEYANDAPTDRRETVVVDRGGGSGAGLLVGLAVLILVVVGAFYFLSENNRNDRLRTDAVTQAAGSVGDAAKKVGGAAEKAGDDVTKQ